LYASVFVYVCFLINFSTFKLDTKNNANFGAVSSKNAPNLTRYNLLKDTPKILSYTVSKLMRFLRHSVVLIM